MLFCKNLEETPSPRRGGISTTMPDKSTSSEPATLAAPQIGLSLRLTVIDVTGGKNPEAKIVLANPEIIHAEGEVREEEGCLSVPGFRGYVIRPQFVTVKAENAKGESYEIRGENLLARAFCHEIDHLDGILFLQHLSMLKRDLIKRKIKKLRKQGEW